MIWSVCQHHKHCQVISKGTLIKLLLILSGSVETNPGPRRQIKYPCGICRKAVRSNQESIACDQCDQWSHIACIGMNDIIFNCHTNDSQLQWTCINCAIPDINSSFLDSSFESSSSSDSEFSEPRFKAQNLRIMNVNFQGLWGKKELLQKEILKSNVDVIIGSETHIDPCH